MKEIIRRYCISTPGSSMHRGEDSRVNTMGLFRSIAVASAAAAVAVSGYVPPHMELPVSWTDVSKATVCYLCILSHTTA